jgi:hypothetical protein
MMRSVLAISVLALILASCAGGSGHGTSPAGSESGVRGTVTYGPLCPVERVGSPCPDRPWRGNVRAQRTDGTLVRQVFTDADGAFTLPLDPGTYDIVPAIPEDSMPNAKARRVTVTEGHFVTVTMQVDSGMR